MVPEYRSKYSVYDADDIEHENNDEFLIVANEGSDSEWRWMLNCRNDELFDF